jgi:hypothetical protein
MGGAASAKEGASGGQLGHAIRWSRLLDGRVLALEFGDKNAMTAMLGRVSAYSEGQGAKGAWVGGGGGGG